MKRLLRWAFNLAAAASMLLLILVAVLWVLSYYREDAISKIGPGEAIGIASSRGRFDYYAQDSRSQLYSPGVSQSTPDWSFQSTSHPGRFDTGRDTWFNRLGVAIEWRDKVDAMVFSNQPTFNIETELVFPHWLLALVLALLPAGWAALSVRWARRRATEHLCCAKCGYDLRASAERCPECGTPIPAKLEEPA